MASLLLNLCGSLPCCILGRVWYVHLHVQRAVIRGGMGVHMTPLTVQILVPPHSGLGVQGFVNANLTFQVDLKLCL